MLVTQIAFQNSLSIITHQWHFGIPTWAKEAKGDGGNSIFFCKELDLLVVVTAGNYNKWKMMHNSYAVLRDYVIPSITR